MCVCPIGGERWIRYLLGCGAKGKSMEREGDAIQRIRLSPWGTCPRRWALR